MVLWSKRILKVSCISMLHNEQRGKRREPSQFLWIETKLEKNTRETRLSTGINDWKLKHLYQVKEKATLFKSNFENLCQNTKTQNGKFEKRVLNDCPLEKDIPLTISYDQPWRERTEKRKNLLMIYSELREKIRENLFCMMHVKWIKVCEVLILTKANSSKMNEMSLKNKFVFKWAG